MISFKVDGWFGEIGICTTTFALNGHLVEEVKRFLKQETLGVRRTHGETIRTAPTETSKASLPTSDPKRRNIHETTSRKLHREFLELLPGVKFFFFLKIRLQFFVLCDSVRFFSFLGPE